MDPFSADLWDYLEDIPYMPSREDRDALLAKGDDERVRIWDYFFRLQPEDVGAPQRAEIRAVRADLEAEFQVYQETVEQLEFDLRAAERALLADRRRNLIIGVPLLLIGMLLAVFLVRTGRSTNSVLFCGGVLGLPGVFLLVRFGLNTLGLSNARKGKDAQVEDRKAIRDRQIRAARMRINALERQVEVLKQQIPEPPSDNQVREWLNADLARLNRRSIEMTGLEGRLVPVEDFSSLGDLMLQDNPIRVMGPGELQEVDRIPRTFTHEVNPDLNKHLSARRAYILADGRSVDLLYGVYFIKYIAVTEDMLATYSLFYDLIAGKISGESVSEQYYRDVVAITTTRETRPIMLGVDSQDYIMVEDAPTFTIYLSGAEERTVTYVNENYFLEIRDKLGLDSDQVSRIYWVQDSDRIAQDTVRLLRYYLRESKGEDSSMGSDRSGADRSPFSL
jgi:hypothetical protein